MLTGIVVCVRDAAGCRSAARCASSGGTTSPTPTARGAARAAPTRWSRCRTRGRDPRDRAGREHRQAERQVVARPDLVVLGDVVAVRCRARSGVRLDPQRVVALGVAERLAGHVLVERTLQRGPGVAEQVVGRRRSAARSRTSTACTASCRRCAPARTGRPRRPDPRSAPGSARRAGPQFIVRRSIVHESWMKMPMSPFRNSSDRSGVL